MRYPSLILLLVGLVSCGLLGPPLVPTATPGPTPVEPALPPLDRAAAATQAVTPSPDVLAAEAAPAGWVTEPLPAPLIAAVSYPSEYDYYSGQVPSVDGVLTEVPDSFTVHNTSQGQSFILTVRWGNVEPGLPSESVEPQPFDLANWAPALIYPETPCGPPAYGTR